MARWSDLAEWRGPTENQGGAMKEHRGIVVHIAEGYYEGTISWQRNPAVDVSSHFIVGRDGKVAQMVDTDTTAWTQSAGNGHWLSVENAGFTPSDDHYIAGWEFLTPQQIEANAALLARAHQVYGVPLQLATNPDGYGLGHHSMGCNWPSGAWGHCDCPGTAIIAQKSQILSRAIALTGGDDMDSNEVEKNAWNADVYLWKFITGEDEIPDIRTNPNNPADKAVITNVVGQTIKRIDANLAKLQTGGVDMAKLIDGVRAAVREETAAAEMRMDAKLQALEAKMRDAVADGLEGGSAAVRGS